MESDSNSNNDDVGEQIRVSLTLASECKDPSLEVPSEPIAVPASIGRKGLSAVINHLLDRHVTVEDEHEMDDDIDELEDDRLPSLTFDFIVGKNNRLLRTGVEREARRSGLSLEEALPITYFPAQEQPELSAESEPLPDWISGMSFVSTDKHQWLCTATYDGSIHLFEPVPSENEDEVVLKKVSEKKGVHSGPIKCVNAAVDKDLTLWIASGSLDHTLSLCRLDPSAKKQLEYHSICTGAHTSAVSDVDIFGPTKLLASGDWDGSVAVWNFSAAPEDPMEDQQPVKRIKTKSGSTVADSTDTKSLTPKISIQAHSSKISGVSWGNCEKRNQSAPQQLITGSWDHSLKLWDVERQDCLVTLNGTRVISCLDTAYYSTGIVASGHPDCTIRLWDIRTANCKESSLTVSDSTFKPSHKAWVSALQWSPRNAYHLASTSHDGTIKYWDIRSTLPLHTVRAFPKTEKGLSLAFGELKDDSGFLFAGGTDSIVKQFRNEKPQDRLND